MLFVLHSDSFIIVMGQGRIRAHFFKNRIRNFTCSILRVSSLSHMNRCVLIRIMQPPSKDGTRNQSMSERRSLSGIQSGALFLSSASRALLIFLKKGRKVSAIRKRWQAGAQNALFFNALSFLSLPE